MLRSFILPLTVLMITPLGLPASAEAQDSVTAFVGQRLLGKLIDEVWDSATGKPNVRLLEQQLQELESNAVMRGEMRDEIRKLRGQIDERTTRREFRNLAEHTVAEIGSIKLRLDDLEERIEKLEVEKEDLKNKTKNALDSRFFSLRGEQFMEAKNYRRAIANCSIAIHIDNNNSMAYFVRARVFEALEAPQIVVIDSTQSIRCDPKNPLAYTLRASASGRLNEYDKAVEDYTKALDCDPNFAFAYCGRGWAYSEQKKYLKAIGDYTKAINLDPTTQAAYIGRGIMYSALEKYGDAIADFDEAIRLNPRDAYSYNARGYLYFKTNEYSKAIEDYTKAIDSDPRYAPAYNNRKFAYVSRGLPGDLRLAEEDHQKEQSLPKIPGTNHR